MKKYISLLLCFIILISFFSGCSTNKDDGGDSPAQKENASQDAQPLVVFYPRWLYNNDYFFLEAARIFTETYGVEVEFYPAKSMGEMRDEGGLALGYNPLDDYNIKLKTEVMSGKGPDVLIGLPFFHLLGDLYKTIDTGIFADLNVFIDTDDEFDIRDYEDVILDSGLYKGGRYILPLDYCVTAALTTEERLASYGLTPDDFSTYERFISSWEKLLADGTTLFDDHRGGDWLVLSLSGWLDECVDFEASKADLDLPSFEPIIRLMKQNLSLSLDLSDSNYIAAMEQNPDAAGSGGLFHGVYLLYMYVYMCELAHESGNDVIYLPIPNYEGMSTAVIENYCVISSASQNPEMAWNFLKILLSEELLKTNAAKSFFSLRMPVRKDAFEDYFNRVFDSDADSYFISADIDAEWYKELAKGIWRSFDNAVIPHTKGSLVYGQMYDYITGDNDDFLGLKMKAENYFRIYLSE